MAFALTMRTNENAPDGDLTGSGGDDTTGK